MKRWIPALILAITVIAVTSGCSDSGEGEVVTTDSGLQYVDLEVGDGDSPGLGDTVVVHYTGWLEDGTKFDSSLDRGEPLEFQIGMGGVIRGWDIGMATMKVGGKRKLIVPPGLAYGSEGRGDVIPPNATLTFEVELLEIRE
jgi:peptidylprolyl isomerase